MRIILNEYDKQCLTECIEKLGEAMDKLNGTNIILKDIDTQIYNLSNYIKYILKDEDLNNVYKCGSTLQVV